MNICNCLEDLSAYLCDIPHEWREDIVKALCFVLEDDPITCSDIKSCETVTYLSPFVLSGNVFYQDTLHVSFKDEKGRTYTRSINLRTALDNLFADLNPRCINGGTWVGLDTPEDKLNAIIARGCDECCQTTTTTSSTTTTTTANPCVCYTYQIRNLSGASIGIFYYNCSAPYDQIFQTIANGETTQICSCSTWTKPAGAGITVINMGVGCFATTTTSTTTTSSSTTTTTTAAPTTTTSTSTTSTSSTSTSSTSSTSSSSTSSTSSSSTSSTSTSSTTTSSSTTTTTTAAPVLCRSYQVEALPTVSLEWEDCETGAPLSTTLTSGTIQTFCVREGTLNVTAGAADIIDLGPC